MSGISIKRKFAVLWPYLALLALALTAAGFWFLGATKIKKSLYESPNISFNNISVRGFPSQFRVILENYSLQLQQGNLSGEKLTAVRMFYDFNHTIIWAEGSLQFQGKSGDRLTLTGDAMQASHVMSKDGEDYFSDARISVDLQNPQIQVRPVFVEGTNISSDQIQFYILPTETNQTRILFNAGNLIFAKTDNQNILTLKKAIVETQFPETPDANDNIIFNKMILNINLPSGALLPIQANGQLGQSKEGYLDGKLNLNFKNMTSVLETLNTRGILTSDQAAFLSFALQLNTDPTKKSVSDTDMFPLSLTFKRGRTFFGPIDIGPAPKL